MQGQQLLLRRGSWISVACLAWDSSSSFLAPPPEQAHEGVCVVLHIIFRCWTIHLSSLLQGLREAMLVQWRLACLPGCRGDCPCCLEVLKERPNP